MKKFNLIRNIFKCYDEILKKLLTNWKKLIFFIIEHKKIWNNLNGNSKKRKIRLWKFSLYLWEKKYKM